MESRSNYSPDYVGLSKATISPASSKRARRLPVARLRRRRRRRFPTPGHHARAARRPDPRAPPASHRTPAPRQRQDAARHAGVAPHCSSRTPRGTPAPPPAVGGALLLPDAVRAPPAGIWTLTPHAAARTPRPPGCRHHAPPPTAAWRLGRLRRTTTPPFLPQPPCHSTTPSSSTTCSTAAGHGPMAKRERAARWSPPSSATADRPHPGAPPTQSDHEPASQAVLLTTAHLHTPGPVDRPHWPPAVPAPCTAIPTQPDQKPASFQVSLATGKQRAMQTGKIGVGPCVGEWACATIGEGFVTCRCKESRC
ncbi:extensin-like [Panicum virgatum]|uniref:extensin-like n=1 Tax=Panicum virgatum TaxID=38727 RepID=UPI0019D587C0|nr:extensin-like [Panicum virgatum]